MKKQHLLPLVFVAAAAQGTEPARFQDMLGDTRLSRIEKPGYKISDFDERKESGVRNNCHIYGSCNNSYPVSDAYSAFFKITEGQQKSF